MSEEEEFVQVVKDEGAEVTEFPLEDNGTILLRTINSQFATAIGLRYKGPSGAWRAIRSGDDGELLPPKGGWGETIYCLTFKEGEEPSRKRKATSDLSSYSESSKSLPDRGNYLLRDLAVLGIPREAKKKELQDYFNDKYGGVTHFIINHDQDGRSKGFGFIKFGNEESAKNALAGEDFFMGKQIFVKTKKVSPMKMYVSGLVDDTTQDELLEYFSQYGTIVDSYVPNPFKNYAFFTFASTEDGKACLREQHVFKGQTCKVTLRRESGLNNQSDNGGRGGYGGYGGQSRGYGGPVGGYGGSGGVQGRSGGGYSGSSRNDSSSINDPSMFKNEIRSMLRDVLSGND